MIVVDTGVLVAAINKRDKFHRAAQLVRRYADLPLDTVDAVVVATAEHLGTPKVATVDRKDFQIVVPSHCRAFELLPTLG
ncbi:MULTISPECIES: PIN domain-containing protein [unclassified Frankia]|uniref:PIN domain-containing protein n=1 Tax=unclassified Frankia TaxID=2632575 RepID=UPI001EF6BECA|nr:MULTISPECIES: PIN domain-containing protein [unclassified Frankia]